MDYQQQLERAVSTCREAFGEIPRVGAILGSGLGDVADQALADAGRALSYQDIPGFPPSTVPGHAGRLVVGGLGDGGRAIFMQGRFHFYEGHPIDRVVFGVRVLARLGVRALIITNAAGGIDRALSAGDLMLITDHLNLMGDNPLRGELGGLFGKRFIDMSSAYDPELQLLLREAAGDMPLASGVYAALPGPSYETPAEIRMLRGMGATAVGMSTVPEVIAARQLGVRVAGISCISNMAAGILPQPLSHEEVIETANRVKPAFAAFLIRALSRVDRVIRDQEESP